MVLRQSHISFALACLLACLEWSCAEKSSADPCCSFTALPPASSVQDGYGLLRVTGSTAATYSASDPTGVAYGPAKLNETLKLPPGRYTLSINASRHVIDIVEAREARCTTGTLMVTGHTGERYEVADSTGHTASEVLGAAMSLFPGSYRIAVNNTYASLEVKQGQWTEIRTGTLLVEGTTGETYYVLDSRNRQLAQSTLGRPLAFLPGRYPVKVNNTSITAEIFAGHTSEYRTGNIVVKGLTDELYYVRDTVGRNLNYQSLNKPLAFLPGHFVVTVNNTAMPARVAPDSTSAFETGSLVLTGAGPEYYYVIDESGRELNYSSFNRPLSLFPSDYTVKLGNTLRKATVKPGASTSLEAFH